MYKNDGRMNGLQKCDDLNGLSRWTKLKKLREIEIYKEKLEDKFKLMRN